MWPGETVKVEVADTGVRLSPQGQRLPPWLRDLKLDAPPLRTLTEDLLERGKEGMASRGRSLLQHLRDGV